jgi:flagellar basal body rod protein FlgC
MELDQSIPLLSLAARSMETQRGVLDVFARNIAAAQVAGANGFVRFEPILNQDEEGAPTITSLRARHVKNDGIVGEMLAIMQAQRAFESDATMFSLSKHLAEQTIAVERP